MTKEDNLGKAKFFNSNLFNLIVTVVVTLLTVFIPYFLTIQDKSLRYSFSASPLLNKSDDSLDILYNGKKVKDVYVNDVSFSNDGKHSIKKADILESIKIYVSKSSESLDNCELVSASILSSTPASAINQFKKDLSLGKGFVDFKPTLMNIHDSVDIRIITSECIPAGVKVSGRIDGVRDILYSPKSRSPNVAFLFVPAFLLILLLGIWDRDKPVEQKELEAKRNRVLEDINRHKISNTYNNSEVAMKIARMETYLINYDSEINKFKMFPSKKRIVSMRINYAILSLCMISMLYFFMNSV